MGLDSFVFSFGNDERNNDWKCVGDRVQLNYWRSHRQLHNWFKEYWTKNCPESIRSEYGFSFNCAPIRLNESILKELENTIKYSDLPEDQGFFFGNRTLDFSDKIDYLNFIVDARQHINDGGNLYFMSWW